MERYRRVSYAQVTYFASTIDKEPVVSKLTKAEWAASQPKKSKPALVWRLALEAPNRYPFARIENSNVLVVFKPLDIEQITAKD